MLGGSLRGSRALGPVACAFACCLVLASCERGPSLEWQEAEDHRWRELAVRGQDSGFTRMVPSRTGIDFTNVLSEDLLTESEILANGSGVAIGDVDGDGLADVYLSRVEGPNALYRNRGEWRFEDVTESAGVGLADRRSRAAVFADADGDGDLDLLVSIHSGPNVLFVNDGMGTFQERTTAAGFETRRASSTMTLADTDGDGDLDLYVANYKDRWARDIFSPGQLSFENVVEQRGEEYFIRPEFTDHYRILLEHGLWQRRELAQPDEFYLNDGTGRFQLQSNTSGRFLDEDGEPLRDDPREWGLTARFHDLDGDRDPDLYVTNDLDSPDHIWINDGAGTFQAIPRLSVRSTSAASMSVDFADVDRDGDVDFFVSEMLSRDGRRRRTQVPEMLTPPTRAGDREWRPQVNRNTLQLNRGDATFAETAWYADVAASDWTWSVLFLDVDLDGREDLLATTGHVLDFLDADTRMRLRGGAPSSDWRRRRLAFPVLPLPNVAFRNQGDLRFEEADAAWNFAGEPDISHGMATGDLDGDGDLDIVINRLNRPALVLRNDAAAPRVAVRLRDAPPNTAGIGAEIVVHGGPQPLQSREVGAGGMYLSHSDGQHAFATGQADRVTIEVRWRDGRTSRIEATPNRLYEVYGPTREAHPVDGAPAADSAAAGLARPAGEPEFFEDVSHLLGHMHSEEMLDERGMQPLLPQRLSQLGPGVSWLDADADGDPDLFIGTGGGGKLAFLRNENGTFRHVPTEGPVAVLDQTTVLPMPDGQGGTSLLVGQANYEASGPRQARQAPSVVRYELGGGARDRLQPAGAAVDGGMATTGPLAQADYDGDGDLDLFVGGRTVPAAYPSATDSRFLLNQAGAFEPDSQNAGIVTALGLVSGALFTDIDGDGDPDLCLALDWGPIRLLLNDDGRFADVTQEWGLAGLTGRWNGIASGDLDGDGRLDLIVTGWGQNLAFQPEENRPLLLYYGDFDRNGIFDVVEAQYEDRLGAVTPLRSFPFLSGGLPFIRRNTPTTTAFADATLEEILGQPLGGLDHREASTLSHLALLNRSGSFEPRELPREAQLAPAFHSGVLDIDNDGYEDLFLTLNYFATEWNTPRHDAGRSLWLRGDGRGGLEPVPGQISGLRVYGDPRGAAHADYDGDGRVDIAVSQNGAETKLYRNSGAAPGLRVRLQGDRHNPDAVGAALRIVYQDGEGPLREIQSGSGYWSRNGGVQVMGLQEGRRPIAVWVRWPDGTEFTAPLEAEIREITIRQDRADSG